MADVRARFTAMLLDRAADEAAELPSATVVAVTPGAAADGNALVTVRYLGADLKLPYMAHYTPGVGHKVTLGRVGGTWVIFGRVIGFPKQQILDELEP